MNKTTCGACDPLSVSIVNEFCSLYCNDNRESALNLCHCLVRLKVLNLSNCGLQSVPDGMDNLIHLRWLNLERNKLSTEDLKIIFRLYFLQTLILGCCGLEDIPKEIENISDLRHLNLSTNELKELPSEIGSLAQLRHLDLGHNKFSKVLPDEIGKLVLLQTFILPYWVTQCQIPESFTQLFGLGELIGFKGGSGWSKLRLLKNLNKLLVVRLKIGLDNLDSMELKGMVEDVREAELSNKKHVQKLELIFDDNMDEEEEEIIDALTPHPNLKILYIENYEGSKLPIWIVSPSNQLRKVHLVWCKQLTSLPSLGTLEYLEEVRIYGNTGLEIVGRELLGITTNSTSNFIAFPKLKTLSFSACFNWKEWEDITAEEEESPVFQVMPSLTYLGIRHCLSLTQLPHRLLRKASSLETLELSRSVKLEQRYVNKDGPDWKSISLNNPRLRLNAEW